jgi:hypothetical protein
LHIEAVGYRLTLLKESVLSKPSGGTLSAPEKKDNTCSSETFVSVKNENKIITS